MQDKTTLERLRGRWPLVVSLSIASSSLWMTIVFLLVALASFSPGQKDFFAKAGATSGCILPIAVLLAAVLRDRD